MTAKLNTDRGRFSFAHCWRLKSALSQNASGAQQKTPAKLLATTTTENKTSRPELEWWNYYCTQLLAPDIERARVISMCGVVTLEC